MTDAEKLEIAIKAGDEMMRVLSMLASQAKLSGDVPRVQFLTAVIDQYERSIRGARGFDDPVDR